MGSCPDGAAAIAVPRVPRGLPLYLGDRGGFLQVWGIPQPLPQVSLMQQKAPICAQKHTSGFCMKAEEKEECKIKS